MTVEDPSLSAPPTDEELTDDLADVVDHDVAAEIIDALGDLAASTER